jgi:hypothetical protein
MQIGNLVAHRMFAPVLLNGTSVNVMPTSTAFQSPGGQGGVGLLVINNGATDVLLAPGNDATATVTPHSVAAVRIPAKSSVFFSSPEPIANAPWLAAHSIGSLSTIKVYATNPSVVWLAPAPDLGADLSASPFDSGVPAPFAGYGSLPPGVLGIIGNFSPSGTTTLAASTQPQSVRLAGTGNILKITNSGAAIANFLVGTLGPPPPPISLQSDSVGAGATVVVNANTIVPNFLTATMQSGTGTLTIVRGTATVT